MIKPFQELVKTDQSNRSLDIITGNLVTAVSNLKGNQEARELFQEARGLLRRLYNSRADKARAEAEKFGIDDPLAKASAKRPHYEDAQMYYMQAIKHFDSDVTQKKEDSNAEVTLDKEDSIAEDKQKEEKFNAYVKGIDNRFDREEILRERLEYELVRLQLQAVHHLLNTQNNQELYANLAIIYKQIADIYLREGFNERAEVYLERAFSLNKILTKKELIQVLGTFQVEIQEKLADMYLKMNRWEEAFNLLAEILAREDKTEVIENWFVENYVNKTFRIVIPIYIESDLSIQSKSQQEIDKIKKWLMTDQGKAFLEELVKMRIAKKFNNHDGVIFIEDNNQSVSLTDYVMSKMPSSSPVGESDSFESLGKELTPIVSSPVNHADIRMVYVVLRKLEKEIVLVPLNIHAIKEFSYIDKSFFEAERSAWFGSDYEIWLSTLEAMLAKRVIVIVLVLMKDSESKDAVVINSVAVVSVEEDALENSESRNGAVVHMSSSPLNAEEKKEWRRNKELKAKLALNSSNLDVVATSSPLSQENLARFNKDIKNCSKAEGCETFQARQAEARFTFPIKNSRLPPVPFVPTHHIPLLPNRRGGAGGLQINRLDPLFSLRLYP